MKGESRPRVFKRPEIGRTAWDALADASDQAWLWHRYDLQEALATWPGWHDVSFGVDYRGELAALVPLHLVETRLAGLLPWRLLSSKGGPALADRLPGRGQAAVRSMIREHLIRLAGRFGARQIDLALCPVAPAFRGAACPRVNPLLDLGVRNTLTQTYLIDLSRPQEELWQRLAPHCRTHVRRAEREGFLVREAQGPEDLEKIYRLHLMTYHKNGIPPHPQAYFRFIWERFAALGLARIFVAEREGRLVAANNQACYKKALSGWTAASRADLPTGGVNNLLHWAAIKQARQEGCLWYESGEGWPNAGRGKAKGLTGFKKSFGGELYPAYRGRIYPGRIGRLADALREE